jgi:hypothetical protein
MPVPHFCPVLAEVGILISIPFERRLISRMPTSKLIFG